MKTHNRIAFPKIIFVILGLTCSILSGCSMDSNVQTIPTFTDSTEEIHSAFPSGQRLLISAEEDADTDFITIGQEELGGNYYDDITYHKLSNVTIEIDGVVVKLEEAVRDGLITIEEVTAYAQIDARNGICQETCTSENGLSRFVYTYADFEVEITHDIYETPDGKQHLIRDIDFFQPNGSRHVSHTYIDDASPYGYSLDREDWGIEFEITEANASSLTLAYTQSGGQQIGELSLQYYMIFSEDGPLEELNTADSTPMLERPPVAEIQMDSSAQIMINWEALYGELPPGEYSLFLYIYDIYDESQLHPLMQNFTDRQRYTVVFTVE